MLEDKSAKTGILRYNSFEHNEANKRGASFLINNARPSVVLPDLVHDIYYMKVLHSLQYSASFIIIIIITITIIIIPSPYQRHHMS